MPLKLRTTGLRGSQITGETTVQLNGNLEKAGRTQASVFVEDL